MLVAEVHDVGGEYKVWADPTTVGRSLPLTECVCEYVSCTCYLLGTRLLCLWRVISAPIFYCYSVFFISPEKYLCRHDCNFLL